MHIQPIAGTQDAYVSLVGQNYVESSHVVVRALNDLQFGCFILVMPEADPVRLSRSVSSIICLVTPIHVIIAKISGYQSIGQVTCHDMLCMFPNIAIAFKLCCPQDGLRSLSR
jgi:hypothetical protein